MRVLVVGHVEDVERREYTDKRGQVVRTFDAYLSGYGRSARFGPDRVSGPMEHMPSPGDEVAFMVSVSAKDGNRGAWLSTWVVGRASQDVADVLLLSAADAAQAA